VSLRHRICAIGDEAAADLEGQIAAQRHAGVAGLELRTIDERFVHDLSEAQAALGADAIAAAGLSVPMVDTPIGSWAVTVAVDMREELALLRRTAARARVLGCRRLRVMSYPSDGRPDADWRREALRRMRLLADEAEKLDVVLLHENCHGWASQSAEASLEMLCEVDSPRLRLVFDTGNGLAYGYESPVFLRDVLPWVDHVHVKDGLRGTSGDDVQYVLPGAGHAGVAVCCEMLVRSGYSGWFSLEPHVGLVPHEGFDAGPERKREQHRACVTAFRRLLTDVVAGIDPHDGAEAA
jgi:sugar phosphate isomerase/epimerase